MAPSDKKPSDKKPSDKNPGESASGQAQPWTPLHAHHALKSRFAEERLRAIQEMDRQRTPESARVLIEAMKDRVSYIGAGAARALDRVINTEIADAMIAHFAWASEQGITRDSGCSVRSEIALSLGGYHYHKASDVLQIGIRTSQAEPVAGGLKDTAVVLRANCALALAHLRPPGALMDLSLLLFDAGVDDPAPADDTAVARKAAARAIGILGEPAGSVPLTIRIRATYDEDPDVLIECMNSLVSLEEPSAIRIVQAFLPNRNPYLAAGAAMAMGRSRSLDALHPLLEALQWGSSEFCQAVAAAVAQLRFPEARKALLDRTTSESARIRAACALALAVFLDTEVEACLRSLLKQDPDSKVRAAATRALEGLPLLQEAE